MRNALRFLAFVAAAAAAVGMVYFWKVTPAPAPPSSPLAELDNAFTSLVGNVLPSVVSINAIPAGSADPGETLLRRLLGAGPGATPQPELGSGAIVSPDGYLVTNWHVIENAGAVEIHLNDGRILPARFVGADHTADVAVLKIEASGLAPLPFGDSDEVRIGQMVIAIGNPFGLQETVTKGIISGKSRRMRSEPTNEFFQTDALINPGNSGGPLVDVHGRVIGLNKAVVQNTAGIGFAIPSNTVRRVYESIRDFGRVIRPWFGVVMLPIPPSAAAQLGLPDSQGALIQEVLAGSPAAQAGLRPGDVILAYNDRPIADWKELRSRVGETEPGREIPVDLLRNGKKLRVPVKIEKQPGE